MAVPIRSILIRRSWWFQYDLFLLGDRGSSNKIYSLLVVFVACATSRRGNFGEKSAPLIAPYSYAPGFSLSSFLLHSQVRVISADVPRCSVRLKSSSHRSPSLSLSLSASGCSRVDHGESRITVPTPPLHDSLSVPHPLLEIVPFYQFIQTVASLSEGQQSIICWPHGILSGVPAVARRPRANTGPRI
ncbi:hypothetical protein J6590_046808 [Homalodisca vitripennis]|nr:hypothetical protein J6590_046808 [Homalodisca vitripennis]